MERLADLHVHTYLSDGTFSPKEVVERAKDMGLSCIAITDHDCVDGIEPALEAGEKIGIETIPGVELTAEEKNVEVHILGFFINYKDEPFLKLLKTIRQSRVERIYLMIEKLKKYNIVIDPEEVFKTSGPGSVGRLHVAFVMEKDGYVSSVKEAFRRYIGDRAPCYVKHFEISAKNAISEIKRIGGVAVFAHPYVMGEDRFIPQFVKYGLTGIEAYHSDHPTSASKYYVELAQKYKLIITGGSDCHGLGKGEILMGKVKVPYELVEGLKRCAEKTRNI
ncbi:MAG: hypothetical protein AMJ78_09845 [Omnitrophica WOR_2 bacterium SM23_29]|nr:MAG: hypothetical protein AMJ78_09845 [Omnitrophica WOR_2 bacterium SM23_29]